MRPVDHTTVGIDAPEEQFLKFIAKQTTSADPNSGEARPGAVVGVTIGSPM